MESERRPRWVGVGGWEGGTHTGGCCGVGTHLAELDGVGEVDEVWQAHDVRGPLLRTKGGKALRRATLPTTAELRRPSRALATISTALNSAWWGILATASPQASTTHPGTTAPLLLPPLVPLAPPAPSMASNMPKQARTTSLCSSGMSMSLMHASAQRETSSVPGQHGAPAPPPASTTTPTQQPAA